MKIEALNCPNCGAAARSDAAQCAFCHSRLKTQICPKCFGTMFIGSKFCVHCGAKAVAAEFKTDEKSGDCPRCKIRLHWLEIGEIRLRGCEKCDGLWSDAETFEELCADTEKQAAVFAALPEKHHDAANQKINYIPCPECRQLMNRNNFARSSGVILDTCKKHGAWFDAEELPRILEFIRQGGLEHAREKEKIHLEEQRKALLEEQRLFSREQAKFSTEFESWKFDPAYSIREFVRTLFD